MKRKITTVSIKLEETFILKDRNYPPPEEEGVYQKNQDDYMEAVRIFCHKNGFILKEDSFLNPFDTEVGIEGGTIRVTDAGGINTYTVCVEDKHRWTLTDLTESNEK